MTACPTTVDLIRDYGTKMKLRCSCCGKPSLYEIQMKTDSYYLCSYCDVDISHRKWT